MAGNVILLQFAREPRPGHVKTRMQPQLSAQQACSLHRELVLWTCGRLLESGLGEVEVCVAGDVSDPLFRQCRELGAGRIIRQCGDDLGQRMLFALCAGLQRHDKVILVGSDCPGISPAYLHLAAAALDESAVVLGPAEDGGFVLIGARCTNPHMFDTVKWGGDEVMAATAGNLARLGLSCSELPTLADIDRPEDLPLWEAARSLVL